MSGVVENALRMLGILIEEGTGELNRGELRSRMGLPKEEFDKAYLFLAQDGYISGTMGGDAGSCWVELPGFNYHEQQRRQRLPISHLAKGIARFIGRHAKTEGASVAREDICSELEINRESYLEAMQELDDYGLIEEKVKIDQAPFETVNLTDKGRRAIRSGFEREMPTVTQQIGAVFEGPVSGATIQAVAQAYQSVVQQSVETGDIEGLIEAISNSSFR